MSTQTVRLEANECRYTLVDVLAFFFFFFALITYVGSSYCTTVGFVTTRSNLVYKFLTAGTTTHRIPHVINLSSVAETMSSTTAADLLQASLTGELGGEVAAAFDAARERGNAFFRRGEYDSALSAYTEAETLNPLSPVPPSNRALVYLKQQRWQQAREQCAIALQLLQELPSQNNNDPKWSDNLKVKLLLRRSAACDKLHLYQLSADDLSQVLRLQPDNAQARTDLESLKRNHGITPATQRQRAVAGTPARLKIREVDEARGNGGEAHVNGGGKMPSVSQISHTPSDLQQVHRLDAAVLQRLTDKVCTRTPQNAAEFEHAWRTLSASADRRADARRGVYLVHTVRADSVRRGILGESLTPQTLVHIGRALLAVVNDEEVMKDHTRHDRVGQMNVVVDFLNALQSTPRFDLLVLFLSRDEKLVFKHLTDKLDHLLGAASGNFSSLRRAFLVDDIKE